MAKTVFPHPLEHMPRAGDREIRMKPARALPLIRNMEGDRHGTEP